MNDGLGGEERWGEKQGEGNEEVAQEKVISKAQTGCGRHTCGERHPVCIHADN